jgi:guanidinopropionase
MVLYHLGNRGLKVFSALPCADIVEVSPPFDTGGITSMTAATILFELLCMLAQARVQREPMSRG